MRWNLAEARTAWGASWIALALLVAVTTASIGRADLAPVRAATMATERTAGCELAGHDGIDCTTAAGPGVSVGKLLTGALVAIGIGAVWIRERRLWQY